MTADMERLKVLHVLTGMLLEQQKLIEKQKEDHNQQCLRLDKETEDMRKRLSGISEALLEAQRDPAETAETTLNRLMAEVNKQVTK